MSNNKLFQASKRAAEGVNIDIELNDEVIRSIAKKLAITMTISNDSVAQIVSAQQAEDCFAYAIQVVLRQNSGAKPSFEFVPTFLSDISLPFTSVYRGVRITTNQIDAINRPDCYDTFLDVLVSIGVPVGKVLKVDPFGESNVLKVGIIDVAGADMLVGVASEATIEELVVRSMLSVSKEAQDRLDRILGHMDCMYVSKDELVRQWALALPVGKRG